MGLLCGLAVRSSVPAAGPPPPARGAWPRPSPCSPRCARVGSSTRVSGDRRHASQGAIGSSGLRAVARAPRVACTAARAVPRAGLGKRSCFTWNIGRGCWGRIRVFHVERPWRRRWLHGRDHGDGPPSPCPYQRGCLVGRPERRGQWLVGAVVRVRTATVAPSAWRIWAAARPSSARRPRGANGRRGRVGGLADGEAAAGVEEADGALGGDRGGAEAAGDDQVVGAAVVRGRGRRPRPGPVTTSMRAARPRRLDRLGRGRPCGVRRRRGARRRRVGPRRGRARGRGGRRRCRDRGSGPAAGPSADGERLGVGELVVDRPGPEEALRVGRPRSASSSRRHGRASSGAGGSPPGAGAPRPRTTVAQTPSISATASCTTLRSDADIGSSAWSSPGLEHLLGELAGERGRAPPAAWPGSRRRRR